MGDFRRLINYRNAALAWFGLLLAFVLVGFRDYGIAWDEPFHIIYGQAIVDYYRGWLNGTPDTTALSYRNLYLYGGAFDLLTTLLTGWLGRITPFAEIDLRHLVTGLTGILGLVGAWSTTRLLAGARAGFWAVVLLAITPLYAGHLFFNPKDLPFAVGYIWSLYFLARILGDFPRVRWSNLAWFGLVAGFTLGVRIGGVFLFFYLGLALLWNFGRVWRSGTAAGWKSFLRLVFLPVVFSGSIAYLVMLIGWPYAQQDALRYPVQALLQMSQFDWPYGVLYRGEMVSAAFLPPDYIFRYLLISLPELVLLLLFGGGVLLALEWRKGRTAGQPPSVLALGSILLVLAVLVPILTAIIGRSTLYDGIRHFLFIIPPLACLAGISLDRLLARLSAWKAPAAVAVTLLAGLCVVYQAAALARLHPYEYIYYNQLVGGVTQAYRDYETDYWGVAASEAAQWLVRYLEDQGRAGGAPVQVFVAGANEFSAQNYFPEWIEFSPDYDRAEYFIGGIRSFSMDDLPGIELFTVTRMGVPLAVVKELDR